MLNYDIMLLYNQIEVTEKKKKSEVNEKKEKSEVSAKKHSRGMLNQCSRVLMFSRWDHKWWLV